MRKPCHQEGGWGWSIPQLDVRRIVEEVCQTSQTGRCWGWMLQQFGIHVDGANGIIFQRYPEHRKESQEKKKKCQE